MDLYKERNKLKKYNRNHLNFSTIHEHIDSDFLINLESKTVKSK